VTARQTNELDRCKSPALVTHFPVVHVVGILIDFLTHATPSKTTYPKLVITATYSNDMVSALRPDSHLIPTGIMQGRAEVRPIR